MISVWEPQQLLVTFKTMLCMVHKITHFSDIAMKISENQYAPTLIMSQLKSNFLVDSLAFMVGNCKRLQH